MRDLHIEVVVVEAITEAITKVVIVVIMKAICGVAIVEAMIKEVVIKEKEAVELMVIEEIIRALEVVQIMMFGEKIVKHLDRKQMIRILFNLRIPEKKVTGITMDIKGEMEIVDITKTNHRGITMLKKLKQNLSLKSKVIRELAIIKIVVIACIINKEKIMINKLNQNLKFVKKTRIREVMGTVDTAKTTINSEIAMIKNLKMVTEVVIEEINRAEVIIVEIITKKKRMDSVLVTLITKKISKLV